MTTETKLDYIGLKFAIVCAALAVIVLADCGPHRVRAQQRVGPGNDLGLALGMLYVHEANWNGDADYPALFWAIHNRAEQRGLRPIQQVRGYATSLWVPRTERQRWISSLPREGRRPVQWEARMPWRVAAEHWWPLLELARNHIEDPPPNPCDGRVEHWGGPTIPIDRHRAQLAVRAGRWRALDCGETHNRYFSVRRRARRPQL